MKPDVPAVKGDYRKAYYQLENIVNSQEEKACEDRQRTSFCHLLKFR